MTNGVGAPNVAASVDAMNQLLVNAQKKMTNQAEKLVKLSVEASVGAESGKGAAVDMIA